MRRIAILTTAIAIGLAFHTAPASAQSQGQGLGGVIDALSGMLGGAQRLHGHVVVSRDTTLVLRADDGRTYTIDTAGVDQRLRSIVQPGDGATVSVRAPRDGAKGELAATEVTPDPAGTEARKSFQTVGGTIDQVEKDRVLFRTRDGLVLPVDVRAIRGLPPLGPKDHATLYYERGRGQEIVGVWIEPGGSSPAAAVREPRQDARRDETQRDRGRDQARRELEQVYGFVESVTVSGFTLNGDDGTRYMVQTNHLDHTRLPVVRPGDLVTVVARRAGDPDTLIAEFVRPESAGRR